MLILGKKEKSKRSGFLINRRNGGIRTKAVATVGWYAQVWDCWWRVLLKIAELAYEY